MRKIDTLKKLIQDAPKLNALRRLIFAGKQAISLAEIAQASKHLKTMDASLADIAQTLKRLERARGKK